MEVRLLSSALALLVLRHSSIHIKDFTCVWRLLSSALTFVRALSTRRCVLRKCCACATPLLGTSLTPHWLIQKIEARMTMNCVRKPAKKEVSLWIDF